MRKFIQLSFLLFSLNLSAQVEWSGILDAGFTMGGSESNQLSNGISNKYPNFNIQSLNLFIYSPISDGFSFNGKIYYDPALYGSNSFPRIVFANVSWDPEGENFGFSIGKILTPFGLFPKRQHSPDNISFLPPLIYGYFVNVDPSRGYWPKAGETGSYGSDDKVGTPIAFRSGYQTGIKGYFVYDDWVDVEIALTNSPVSYSVETKTNNSICTVGRLGFKPVIWYNFGFSWSYGSFMQNNDDIVNEKKYKQKTLGMDYLIAYSYFELSGEYIFNQWTAPKFANEIYQRDSNQNLLEYSLISHAIYIDLKIDIPQVPGLFLAGRFDRLYFPTFINPKDVNLIERWDADIDRFTGTIGYRASKEVILKMVGFIQKNKTGIDPKDDAVAFQTSVSF